MSNDNIWLICKKCNERFRLMKYYPGVSSDSGLSSFVPFADTINSFMVSHIERHFLEDYQAMPSNLFGNPRFRLSTDDEENPEEINERRYILEKIQDNEIRESNTKEDKK